MKAAVVLGTRPEIIKLAPVIRALESAGHTFFILHSGQHYSPNMDSIIFEDLELPQPRYNLDIGHLEYRKRVGVAMREMKRIFEDEWPDVVIVQGDTFTVLMGALAAKKLDRPVAHLEAGLRSHDLTMPEENNRIITDHVAEMLYPPTQAALQNIIDEGMEDAASAVFGNTVVDALLQSLELSQRKSTIINDLKLESKGYLLVTAHRQENVDIRERLAGILEGVEKAGKELKLPVVFAIHPRTVKRMEEFGMKRPKSIRFIEPPGYLDFIALENNARIILTDSGGIQEEASVLHVPCVTMRDNTERPETVDAGCNALAGTSADTIATEAKRMAEEKIDWQELYGSGDTSKRIVQHLDEAVRKRKSPLERTKWILRSAARMLGGK